MDGYVAFRGRTMPRFLVALAVAVGTLACLATPRAMAATWSQPHTLAVGSSSQRAVLCDLAVSVDGETVVTWMAEPSRSLGRKTRSAYVARKPRGGDWSAPMIVWRDRVGLPDSIVSNGLYAFCPQIALGSHGSLDLLWDQARETAIDPKHSRRVVTGQSSLMMRRLNSRNRWSATERLGQATLGFRGSVRTNRRGEAIAALGRLKVISRSVSGRWGAVTSLRKNFANVGAHQGDLASVALGNSGRAVIVPPLVNNRVRVVTRTDGHWSNAVTVSDTSGLCRPSGGLPGAAVSDAGVALVTWPCETHSATPKPNVIREAIQAARLAPGAGNQWVRSDVELFESPNGPQGPLASQVFGSPTVGYDADDRAQIVYTRLVDPSAPVASRAFQTVQSTDDTTIWSTPGTLTEGFFQSAGPNASPGEVVVVGSSEPPTPRRLLGTLLRSRSGDWSAPLTVPGTSGLDGASSASGGGVAALGWGPGVRVSTISFG